MKLRNKKTGEIIEITGEANALTVWKGVGENPSYKSISALLDEWEDYYTPQEPQEEIGRQLISSPYDTDFYLADEKQQEAFREFCREEDSRPENQKIPTDVYSDNAQCLSKDFGGVLSGNDRPRNMSEFNAWRSGDDFLKVREENEQLGRERWLHFVEEHGLEKFVEHKEPLIKDEKIRKAVRAWADVNRVNKLEFGRSSYEKWCLHENYEVKIQFRHTDDYGMTDGETYTITELCGEEE